MLLIIFLDKFNGHPAYAVNILMALESQTGRVVDFSTLHTTLKRMDDKGFVTFCGLNP